MYKSIEYTMKVPTLNKGEAHSILLGHHYLTKLRFYKRNTWEILYQISIF